MASTAILSTAWIGVVEDWLVQKGERYTVLYKATDQTNVPEYLGLFDGGILAVNSFFGNSMKNEFDIYIHPDRRSLDTQWQKDWNMPTFKSECWMVASGVANKLDILSPQKWEQEACEHIYAELTKTQRLITHELVHVFHGQHNKSPDFSNTEGIDWFVEGLATYASGQCDSLRLAEVKKACQENRIPGSLDQFWTGKLKYGLSGSVIMFIDHRFGRKKIKELLPFTKKTEILSALGLTETELLEEWKKYVNNR